jgi:arylsulfatase A-like enzyme
LELDLEGIVTMAGKGVQTVLGLIVAAMSVTGCGAPRYVLSATVEPPQVVSRAARVTDHVLLVSIDGLRPDAIGTFATPTLRRLMREGSYTLTAQTIMPSKTLPSHTSMLTGELPERHGVRWNNVLTAKKDLVELPTIFSVARSHGYRTAAFFSKSKFHPLQRPGTLDYSQAPGGWFGRWHADRTTGDVVTYLAGARPNVLFVHLSDPDHAGHGSGWMSKDYGRAVEAADTAVATIVAAADRTYGHSNYSVIVTADHGGHDRDHGSSDPRDVTIPWIAWGRGVVPGEIVDSVVRTTDTAASVLYLLGLEEPTEWAGTPVLAAFESSAATQ